MMEKSEKIERSLLLWNCSLLDILHFHPEAGEMCRSDSVMCRFTLSRTLGFTRLAKSQKVLVEVARSGAPRERMGEGRGEARAWEFAALVRMRAEFEHLAHSSGKMLCSVSTRSPGRVSTTPCNATNPSPSRRASSARPPRITPGPSTSKSRTGSSAKRSFFQPE